MLNRESLKRKLPKWKVALILIILVWIWIIFAFISSCINYDVDLKKLEQIKERSDSISQQIKVGEVDEETGLVLAIKQKRIDPPLVSKWGWCREQLHKETMAILNDNKLTDLQKSDKLALLSVDRCSKYQNDHNWYYRPQGE